MKIRYKVRFLATAMMFSSGVIADNFYIGIDVGKLTFDQEFLTDIENLGLAAGYSWNT